MVSSEQTTNADERVELDHAAGTLAALLAAVGSTGHRVVVEDGGRAVGAIVSVADLRRLWNDDRRRAMAEIGLARVSDAFADVPIDELEREVTAAIADVRAEEQAARDAQRHG